MRVKLDKLEDQRVKQQQQNGDAATNQQQNYCVSVQRSQLEQIQKSQDLKKRTELANEWAEEEDRKIREKFSKKATDAALAFLES